MVGWLVGWLGGWGGIEIKANSAQLELELGLRLAIKKIQCRSGTASAVLMESFYRVFLVSIETKSFF